MYCWCHLRNYSWRVVTLERIGYVTGGCVGSDFHGTGMGCTFGERSKVRTVGLTWLVAVSHANVASCWWWGYMFIMDAWFYGVQLLLWYSWSSSLVEGMRLIAMIGLICLVIRNGESLRVSLPLSVSVVCFRVSKAISTTLHVFDRYVNLTWIGLTKLMNNALVLCRFVW